MGPPCSTFRQVLWSSNGCRETEMKIEQATDNYTRDKNTNIGRNRFKFNFLIFMNIGNNFNQIIKI